MDTQFNKMTQNAPKNSAIDEFKVLPGMGNQLLPAHWHMEVDLEEDLWLDQEEFAQGIPWR